VISEPEFQALAAQGFNRIPLMAQAFADLETPLSLYLKLAHMPGDADAPDADSGRYSFLLESVVGGERYGRYSFIGLPARTLLRASGFGADVRTEVVTDGVVVETSRDNPLDFIASYQKRFKVALRPGLPPFLRWTGRLLWLRCRAVYREKAAVNLPALRSGLSRISSCCSVRNWQLLITCRANCI
jgi:anthranilate synthase component 1